MQKEDLDGAIVAVDVASPFILVQPTGVGYWKVYHVRYSGLHTIDAMGEDDESLIVEVHSELSDSFLSRADATRAIENHLQRVEEMQEEDAKRMGYRL
jgi:hypothetical protein